MLPQIDVRIATMEDAVFLAAFGARVFSESYAAENDPQDMAAYLAKAFSPHKQAGEINQPGSRFFIAEISGEAVGYARVQVGPAPTCITGANPIEMVRMYAVASMKGKGVGSALMQACLAYGRAGGHDVMWLSVWQKNPRAIAFYRKWGFSIAGTATFTIGADVQDDWIMACPLTG